MTKKLNTRGTRGQDATEARAQLKQFRHDLAILKRKGIVGKKYDARSQLPTKYLKTQIAQFVDVLSGDAGSVRVKDKKRRAEYKAQGMRVKGDRVVVSKAPNETVRATKSGKFVRKWKGKGGNIQMVNMNLSKTDLNAFIDKLRKNKVKLSDDEELMFQIFGNNSIRGFRDEENQTAQEGMADYLERYQCIQVAIEAGGEQEAEMIEDIVIMKITRDKETHIWPEPHPNPKARERDAENERRLYERRKRARERRLGAMSDKRAMEYSEARAQTERERRANAAKTMTPAQLEKQKEAARQRAKKSRDTRKNK
jgi:hypothetical protein